MDVEKAKGKKRGITQSGGCELVLHWGTSKRLRGGKKDTAAVKKAITADKSTNRIAKQACRPHKQGTGDHKSDLSETKPRDLPNKGLISRLKSSVSSAFASKGLVRHRVSSSQRSLSKSKRGKHILDNLNKSIISPPREEKMVVARRGLEVGVHIGTFGDELQNLEVYLMPKFMIALSHKEKEEDFMAIKGVRLPIRPRRRAKHVQKALHCVSPGSWLCELSLDRYEVREKKNGKRKSRGLKAMRSAESDSSKS